MDIADYDPFVPGQLPVGTRTIEAVDDARGRAFPIEIWYPADTTDAGWPAGLDAARDAAALGGVYPLVVFSHHSGGDRRSASFLCTHLASHGYVVAALDHSEVVAPELAPAAGETKADRSARIDALIASRVPDVRFLIDHLLSLGVPARPGDAANSGSAAGPGAAASLDAGRIGLVGHSFGGWTVLATPEVEPRVRAVVALGPGGNSNPKPGILPLSLTFDWGRDVPTLYLAAENDTPIPLAGIYQLFERTQASKRMFVLCRADHQHFLDDVEGQHEAIRATSLPGDAAWIPAAMRPMAELCPGEEAHLFVRGLTLAHMDAAVRQREAAGRYLAGDVEGALTKHGVQAFAHRS
jgi:hypothetical protein